MRLRSAITAAAGHFPPNAAAKPPLTAKRPDNGRFFRKFDIICWPFIV